MKFVHLYVVGIFLLAAIDVVYANEDGTSPILQPDDVWVEHLLWRSEQKDIGPFQREGLLREALRLRPFNDRVLDQLVNFYQEEGPVWMVSILQSSTNSVSLDDDEDHQEDMWLPRDDEIALFRSFLKTGQLGEAEQRLRRLIASDPNDSELLHMLGQFFMITDEPLLAATTYRHVTLLSPTNSAFVNNYAVCLHELGKTREALDALIGFADRFPDQDDVIMNILTLAGLLEDHQAIIGYSLKWPEISPDLPVAWMNAAHTLLVLDRLDEARHAAEKAFSLASEDVAPLRYLIEIARRQGDEERALELENTLKLRVTPEAYDVWRETGRLPPNAISDDHGVAP